MQRSKQHALKPQDVVVALKVALQGSGRWLTFAELGKELAMSASEVHGASQRAESARLLGREEGRLIAVKSSLQEFLIHGVKYAFPAMIGPVTRGMPTGIGAPSLKDQFARSESDTPVWPDFAGHARGPSLQPLYPSVPAAAAMDSDLYDALALIDAIRMGAARERELATSCLVARLS